jgi:hypothetical protein
MSRWGDRNERETEGGGFAEGLSRGGGDARPRAPEASSAPQGFGANRREPVLVRDRVYQVRPSERAALDVVGRFRVVDGAAMVRWLYGGDASLARADFAALERQGLIDKATLRDGSGLERRLLTLTRDGHSLAQLNAPVGQRLYWGFAKPAECGHDAHLYSAYRREEQRLLNDGCSMKRVVLDYELKRAYFSRLNARAEVRPYGERQREAAQIVQLPIIDGRVVFPDVRIEYEDERGEPGRVDVEVATGNYRGEHIATKTAAGFRVYATALGGGRFSDERSALLLL